MLTAKERTIIVINRSRLFVNSITIALDNNLFSIRLRKIFFPSKISKTEKNKFNIKTIRNKFSKVIFEKEKQTSKKYLLFFGKNNLMSA